MAAPQIILIPGLLNDADLWRDQIADLATAASPVVANITKGSNLHDLVDAVLDVAEETFAIAGFSLGGVVAQEVLKRVPERVTHLGLLDTTMLRDSPERLHDRARLIAMAASTRKFHGFGEALLQNYLAPKNLKNKALVERVRSMTARLGPDVFIRQSQILRPDNRKFLRNIQCPTVVVCGENDGLTPPRIHRDMAIEIPNSRLIILPDSGHLTPMEQPQAVSNILIDLLAIQSEPLIINTAT